MYQEFPEQYIKGKLGLSEHIKVKYLCLMYAMKCVQKTEKIEWIYNGHEIKPQRLNLIPPSTEARNM